MELSDYTLAELQDLYSQATDDYAEYSAQAKNYDAAAKRVKNTSTSLYIEFLGLSSKYHTLASEAAGAQRIYSAEINRRKKNPLFDLRIASCSIDFEKSGNWYRVSKNETVTGNFSISYSGDNPITQAFNVSVFLVDSAGNKVKNLCTARPSYMASGDSLYYSYSFSASNLPQGEYSLLFSVDPECVFSDNDRSNNSKKIENIVLQDAMPDLSPVINSIVSSSPDGVFYPDTSATIKFTVSNNSRNCNSKATTANVYVNGIKKNSVKIVALDKLGSADFEVSIPSWALSSGTADVEVKIDESSANKEFDETNNSALKTITVCNRMADLTIGSIDLTSSSQDGNIYPTDELLLKINVKNISTNLKSGGTKLRIYDKDVLVTTLDVPELSENENIDISTQFDAETFLEGTHSLRVVADAGDDVAEANEGNNEATKDFTVLRRTADLVVSNLKVVCPANNGNGESHSADDIFTFQFDVANNGVEDAEASVAKLMIGGSAAQTEIKVDALKVGESKTYICEIKRSQFSAYSKTTEVSVAVDALQYVDEINKDNNTISSTFDGMGVAESTPMYSIGAFLGTWNPEKYETQSTQKSDTYYGDAFVFIRSIVQYDKQYCVYCGSTKIASFYGKDTKHAGSQDYYYHKIDLSSLAKGTHTLYLTAENLGYTDDIKGTTYTTLLSKHDGYHTVYTNTNGTISDSGKPFSNLVKDLEISDAKVTLDSKHYGGGTIQYTITNKSNYATSTADSYVDIFIDGEWSFATLSKHLEIGEATTVTSSFAQGTLTEGTHTITIGETCSLTVTVEAEPAPDLVVESFTTTSSVQRGQQLTLNFSVRNKGTIAATPSVAYLVSDGVRLGEVRIASIDAGQTLDDLSISIDSNRFATGTRTISLVLDAKGNVAESCEDNNNATCSVTVNPEPVPDLIISSLMTSAASITTKQALILNFTVQNTGNAVAGESIAYIYDGYAKLGEVSVGAIEAGASVACSYSIAAGTLSCGPHSLQVIADGAGDLAESSNANNSGSCFITVDSGSSSGPTPTPEPVILFAPDAPSISVKKYDMNITWNKCTAAKGTKVSYTVKVTNDDGYEFIKESITGNKYTLKNCAVGDYAVSVQAVYTTKGKATESSAWTDGETVFVKDVTAPKTGKITTCLQVSQERILLSWERASDNVGIDHYTLTCNGETISDKIAATTTVYTIEGMKTAGSCKICLIAYDAAGNSSKAATKTIKMLDVTSPSWNEDLVLTAAVDNKKGGTLSWNKDAAEDNVGITQYEVTVYNALGRKVKTYKTKTNSAKIGKLATGDYTCQIVAIDKAGNHSEVSTVCNFAAEDVIDPKIKKLSAKVSYQTAAISWDAADESGSIGKAELVLFNQNGVEVERIDVTDDLDRRYDFENLTVGEKYKIDLTVWDLAGNDAVKSCSVKITKPDPSLLSGGQIASL